jgi:hypothetical protein
MKDSKRERDTPALCRPRAHASPFDIVHGLRQDGNVREMEMLSVELGNARKGIAMLVKAKSRM